MASITRWLLVAAFLLLISVAMTTRQTHFKGRRRGQKSGKSRKKEKVTLREYVHQQKRQPVYCFQCAFSPDKDVFETINAPSIVKDKGGLTKMVYGTRLMKVRRMGGWDKCVGPFNYAHASEYGVSVTECNNNCYARLEKNGNIFRGCYKGEYGVDPFKYGCHKQQGSVWCFCQGHVCNNKEINRKFKGYKKPH